MVLGAVIILALGFAIFYINKPEKPVQKIENVKGYDKNTSIEVYNALPKEFPEEVVISDTTLNHSDIVRKENGDYIVTAVYSSKENILRAMELEQELLKKEKWIETSGQIGSKTGFVQATNSKGDILSITFSINDGGNGTNINFQLEHKN
jgi:hypothetical protein